MKMLFLLLSLLSIFIVCSANPVLVSSGTLTLSGAGSGNLPYVFYSDQDIRFFQWDSVNVSCSERDYLFANSVFNSSHTTQTDIYTNVIVVDYEEQARGVLLVDSQGGLTWKVDINGEFQSEDCGIVGGSVFWVV